MLKRERLERIQVIIYLVAIAIGAVVGWHAPTAAPTMERLLWPTLAVLLYVTFAQVPLLELRAIIGHRRFVAALMVVNFVLAPPLIWLLARFLPPDPAIVLGGYLVLLVPCTDWYVSFTLLGRGDARLAVASTPLLLLAQMIALPLWLWLFVGRELAGIVRAGQFLDAFLGLILLPLALVAFTEWIARHSKPGQRWLALTAWLPVPMLAFTVFLIAGAQIRAVSGAWGLLGAATAVFVGYAILMPFLARGVARCFGVELRARRTVSFSAGTRNSFVVLPLALSLPAGWELTIAVIVL